MDVYQDPDASLPTHVEQDVETALLNALGPLNDASNKMNIALNPTNAGANGSSPTKTDSSPLRPMNAQKLADFKIPPPRQPNFTDSPAKNDDFYAMYHQAAPMPQKPLYPQYASTQPMDKENVYQGGSFADMAAMPYAETDYGYKAPMKRMNEEVSVERPSSKNKKQRFEEEEPFELPDPRDMPPVTDDGTKPTQSYATLIGMAILRAPNRRLTLAQIYKWISDNYAFYRMSELGWQNSIRHNLSLNKAFIKQERPKDDPGKGNYWVIKPGQERPFLQDKKNPIRRITNPDGSQYMQGLPQELAGFRASNGPAIGQFTLAPNPIKKSESKVIDSAKFPDETELSSDGTIPASDPALQEDDDTSAMPPPPAPMRSSPPPQEFGSSPPAMATQPQRKGTPPPAPRFPSTSRSGGRRQKFAGLNDSGYWSSIESSAARGAAHQLTSEADVSRSRMRKGRAEAEIARIRSSSFDSPSKDRRAPTSHFSSSPMRKEDNPLTPAVVFKRPPKPPASISPNTNLRNHRDRIRALLGSPAKAFSPMPEATTWSPAFNLGDENALGFTPFISPYKVARTPWKPSFGDTPSQNNNHATNLFDVFIDEPEEDLTSRGSPEKRAARRPSLARAATSTGILADITGSAKGNLSLPAATASPFSFSPLTNKPDLRSPNKLGSPLKQHTRAISSGDIPTIPEENWWEIDTGDENRPHTASNGKDVAELFGVELPSDGTEEGIDIFQDFGKIGGAAPTLAMPAADRSTGSPVKKTTSMGPPARPGLQRSNTSRW